MTTSKQSPEEWLNEQYEKLHISQNEFARRAGIASSALSNFAAGTCGCQTPIDIANYLGIPATIPLSLVGKVPPPPSSSEAELISYKYQKLDSGRRQMLMNYADFLRSQMPD